MWRAVVLVVLAFIYGFWRGTRGRRYPDRSLCSTRDCLGRSRTLCPTLGRYRIVSRSKCSSMSAWPSGGNSPHSRSRPTRFTSSSPRASQQRWMACRRAVARLSSSLSLACRASLSRARSRTDGSFRVVVASGVACSVAPKEVICRVSHSLGDATCDTCSEPVMPPP